MLLALILTVWFVLGIVLGVKAARSWYGDRYRAYLEGKLKHDKQLHSHYHYCSIYGDCFIVAPSRFKAVGYGVMQALLWPVLQGYSLAAKLIKTLGNVSFSGLEVAAQRELDSALALEKQNYLGKFQAELVSLAFDRNLAIEPLETRVYNLRVRNLISSMRSSGSPLEKSDYEAIDNQYRI